MPIQIKRAATNDECDQVFLLRHQVLVGDGYLERRCDERIYDRFDAFPTTCLLIARIEDRVVGTVRATIDSGIGTSVDEYYDFTPYCSSRRSRVAAGSHFYIAPEFRGHRQLSALLMEMFHFWCFSQGCQYVKGVMNPRTVSLMQRLGYVPLGETRPSERDGLPFRPVLLEMKNLPDFILEFIDRQSLSGSVESFNRLFYEADEVVRCEDGQLLVIQGQVAALPISSNNPLSDQAKVARLHTFNPGDLITPGINGHLSLIATTKVELAVINSRASRSEARSEDGWSYP